MNPQEQLDHLSRQFGYSLLSLGDTYLLLRLLNFSLKNMDQDHGQICQYLNILQSKLQNHIFKESFGSS